MRTRLLTLFAVVLLLASCEPALAQVLRPGYWQDGELRFVEDGQAVPTQERGLGVEVDAETYPYYLGDQTWVIVLHAREPVHIDYADVEIYWRDEFLVVPPDTNTPVLSDTCLPGGPANDPWVVDSGPENVWQRAYVVLERDFGVGDHVLFELVLVEGGGHVPLFGYVHIRYHDWDAGDLALTCSTNWSLDHHAAPEDLPSAPAHTLDVDLNGVFDYADYAYVRSRLWGSGFGVSLVHPAYDYMADTIEVSWECWVSAQVMSNEHGVSSGVYWAADCNGDGEVDAADLGIVLAAYGSACVNLGCMGDPAWSWQADIDGDGEVGQDDLGLLLSMYGEVVVP